MITSTTRRLVGELYQLHVLPLEEVGVIVADEDWAHREGYGRRFSRLENMFRWTMGQKQEYATELREVLLRRKQLKVHFQLQEVGQMTRRFQQHHVSRTLPCRRLECFDFNTG